jgi:hypothetical protein
MQKVFRTVIPHGMITFKSEDPRLQANKMLVRGFMAPTVLNEVTRVIQQPKPIRRIDFLSSSQVIGQQLYKSMIEVLELWKIKARLAQDHPFDMREDMAHSALDALLGAIFNLDKTHSSVAPQIRSLSFLDSVPIPGNDRSPVHFAQAPIPVVARAIVTLTKSLAISFQSPLSEWHHWLFGQLTEMRNAYATKEKLITDEIEKAIERLGNGTDGTYALATCLLDDLLRHEVMSAARAKREPNFKSRTVYDEVS